MKGKNFRPPPPPPKPFPNEKSWTQFIFNMCSSPHSLKITFRALNSPASRLIAFIVVLQPFLGGQFLFLINGGVHVSKAACRALNYAPYFLRFSDNQSPPPPNDKKIGYNSRLTNFSLLAKLFYLLPPGFKKKHLWVFPCANRIFITFRGVCRFFIKGFFFKHLRTFFIFETT